MQSFKKFIEKRPIDINGYVFSHFGQLITNNAVNKALGHACKTLKFEHTYIPFIQQDTLTVAFY